MSHRTERDGQRRPTDVVGNAIALARALTDTLGAIPTAEEL